MHLLARKCDEKNPLAGDFGDAQIFTMSAFDDLDELISAIESVYRCPFNFNSPGLYLPIVNVIDKEVWKLKLKLFDDSNSSSILVELRSCHAAATKAESLSEFCYAFKSAWKVLSERNEFKITLPLIFHSAELDATLTKILSSVFQLCRRECGGSSNGTGSGGSFLLTGPLGVGKTTIMIVIYVLSIILVDNIFPIFIDYSKVALSPFLVVSQKFLGFNGDPAAVITTLSLKGIVLASFTDEIQKLYKSNLPEDAVEIQIIREIAEIGKAFNHFGVASGSSVCTKDYSFRPELYGFEHYATLNNSVYNALKVSPIRQKDEFERLVKVMRGNSSQPLQSTTINELFLATGGVGRLLDTMLTSICAQLSYEVHIPKEYFHERSLEMIIDEMLYQVAVVIDNGSYDPWEHPHSLSVIRVREILSQSRSTTTISWESELNRYCDLSILLKTANAVSLLQPQILRTIRQEYKKTTDRMTMVAFEGTLTGWSTDPSISHPSAGHAIEAIPRQMLAKITESEYNSDVEIDRKSMEFIDIESYNGVWIQGVKNFDGIDGFRFIITESSSHIMEASTTSSATAGAHPTDRRNVDLEISQVKSGRIELEIKKGSSSQKDSAVYIVRSIQKGIELLLKKVDPSKYNVDLKKVYFVTTKIVTTPALEIFEAFEYNGNAIACEVLDLDYILENAKLESNVKKRIENWRSYKDV